MPVYLYKFLSKTYLINFLISFIPVSFIAGNLILNLNILLLILSSIIIYGRDIFRIELWFLDKIILIFFSYILFTGFLNNVYHNESGDYTIIIKSLLYLRFLILYFVIRFLTVKKIFDYKLFFTSCSFCVIFVCLDLVYQYNFGKDIFGFTGLGGRRLSGPFGDEIIAGSYLQRFAFFSFFLFSIFFKIKDEKFFYLTLTLLLFLIVFCMIIAGNRVPFVMFLLMITAFFIFEKKTRKYLISFLLGTSIIFLVIYNFNPSIKSHFKMFANKTTEFAIFLSTIFVEDKKSALIVTEDGYSFISDPKIIAELEKKETTKHALTKNSKINMVKNSEFIEVNGKKIQIPNTHIKEFNSGYQAWMLNKYLGGGIKSFKYNCPKAKVHNCGPHPHNYYLEILSEIGLFGLFIWSIIFVKVFYDTFVKKYFLNSNLKNSQIITPFMFLLFIEIFPIKTTGSFFTSANSTYIFLILAITIALSKEKKIN